MKRFGFELKAIRLAVINFWNRHKNDWKNPKFFTLMILPHDTANVKKIHFNSNWFKVFAILSIVFWLASVFMFFNYFSMKNKISKLAYVEKLNTKQKVELDSLNERMQFIETQLARMQNTDIKIRELLNLEVNVSKTNFAGGITKPEGEEASKILTEKAVAIEKEIKVREKSIVELAEYLEDRKSLFMATPSIWPARGLITSDFGWRKDPVVSVSEFHEGVDISAPYGTQVKSAAEGVVVFAGNDQGYGKAVVIDHGYGIVTRYAHLSQIYVSEGTKVKKSTVIGAVGSSGKSTGPHVHYEVRLEGVPVNPLKYLFS